MNNEELKRMITQAIGDRFKPVYDRLGGVTERIISVANDIINVQKEENNLESRTNKYVNDLNELDGRVDYMDVDQMNLSDRVQEIESAAKEFTQYLDDLEIGVDD